MEAPCTSKYNAGAVQYIPIQFRFSSVHSPTIQVMYSVSQYNADAIQYMWV